MFWFPVKRPSLVTSIFGAALILGAVFNPSYAVAQDTHTVTAPDRTHIDEVLNGLNRGRSIGEVAVAPDGKRLAWIQRTRDGSEILVAPLDNLGKSQQVTVAAKEDLHCQEGQIVWRPDAKALAFFSNCGGIGGQFDLYLDRFDGNPSRRLTYLSGEVSAPAFSPDGTRLAFLYVQGATRPAGALAAMKAPAGVVGEDGVEIQRLAVVPVDDGKQPDPEPVTPVLATPPNLHVYEFDWSPDSKSLAYVAADPPGENNWWVAKLYTRTLEGTGQGVAKAILAPAEVSGQLHGLQIAVPRWSPDGKTIAFIGGLMSDQGATGGDVWIVSAKGGQPHNLTQNRPTSPAWIEWGDDEHIYVGELSGGNCQLVRLRFQTSGSDSNGVGERAATSFDAPIFSVPAMVGDGRMELGLSSTADHSLFVFRASTFDHPQELYLARLDPPAGTHGPQGAGSNLSGVVQLSHLNDSVDPGWGKSISLSWQSDKEKAGSFSVQGWLMLPKEYDPAKKYPLIVEVHGGPASAQIAHWGGGGGLGAAAFSALGYFVLQPNPRGSFGQGEAFTQANRKDFGHGDLDDILAGVDTVLARYPVDPGRVGIMGWSYGGFMTMFAVTQTGRFKAAVAGAGISNWQSYYGENSIDQWMTPYFGASVYDDPAVYARSSAINFIKQAHTPTLVLVGDRDGECPAPQSYEFWHALRSQHVPTQLVVYPNEGHGFVDPAHRRDVMERAVEWFARYLPPGP